MEICFINNRDCLAIQVHLVGKSQPFFPSQPDVSTLKELCYKEGLNKSVLRLLWVSSLCPCGRRLSSDISNILHVVFKCPCGHSHCKQNLDIIACLYKS